VKLKDFFDEAVVQSIAADLRRVSPAFDHEGFVRDATSGLAGLELTPRGWHVAEALRRHLPEDFPDAADVLVASLGPELDGTEGFGMGPFRYMPHVFYVAKYGLDDLEPALAAQHALTKRFSAEFSIRAFLVRHLEETYDRLLTWTTDPNVHVRRLVSEGTRPRLPWAPRLRAFQEDPQLGLALLERLKDDPELYVRRSVANHLNDISKDHPKLAAETGNRWSRGATPERRWIVRHALRSLIKRGDSAALETIGYAGMPHIVVSDVRFSPSPVRKGDTLEFSAELTSTASGPQELLVDYGVHFVKANGAARPKVFKLTKLTLQAGETVRLAGRVRFRDMTTRRHHPGRHVLDLRVNGVVVPMGGVELVA
jgi:3-methyladenine DNA glycosylase AlkC